jgi:hypothetical protein
MKKIILSVLALGLSMGLMAQKVYNGAEPVKGTFLGGAKSGSVIYPESFNDCASIDAPVYYFADGQSLWAGISGTNQYGDMAYGQRYTGNYQVTGIAAVMSTLPVDGTVEELSAAVVDMDGNELASVAFSTADLPEATEDFNFDLVEFNFEQRDITFFSKDIIFKESKINDDKLQLFILLISIMSMCNFCLLIYIKRKVVN